jgi:serine/threonine-protein kinase HipA
VGGPYGMTPLYDVLSAWPIIGNGANQLPVQRAKLAMAVRGKRPHYRLKEIQVRHWRTLAERTAISGLWTRMRHFAESVDATLQRVQTVLPAAFPERVFDKMSAGMRGQVRVFLKEADSA